MGTGPLPTLDLVAPSGRRVSIVPSSLDDRIGELADALGLQHTAALELDGRRVGRHETIGRAGVRRGSRLSPQAAGGAGQPGQDQPESSLVLVVAEAGPATGTIVTLGAGRHVVGRSPSCTVSLADPALEPHHGVFEVADAGSVRFTQLTGRVAAQVDGEPISAAVVVEDGATVGIGCSRLRIGRSAGPGKGAAALTADPADPWRSTVHRTPRPLSRWAPAAIPVPESASSTRLPAGIGVTAAVCTMVGSVVVALVMRSPLFLLLGAVGLLASAGMWVAGRVGAARDGRRAGAIHRRELAAFSTAVAAQRRAQWQHHLATTPPVAEAVVAATTTRADVWGRRADHADAFRVTLGWGPVTWEVALDGSPGDPGTSAGAELTAVVAAAEQFDDAPVPAELGTGAALAIAGSAAASVVRSLIIQLATWTGPADWRLVAVVDEPSSWDWCRWLPHGPADTATVVSADDADAQAATLLQDDGADGRHVVVVTDRPELVAQRTGALRRFLGAARSSALVVHVPPGDAVPAMCRSVLEIGSIGRARWWADTSIAARSDIVHAAGVTLVDAERVARCLAPLRDPEEPSGSETLGTAVSLGALSEHHGVGPIDDAIAVAAAWRAGGPDPAPAAPLGLAADGVVEIDLVRDGPHALVAGTTGAGKSELLRTLVVSLAARCSPDHLTFVLVDYKGGATFDACADLPHTVGLVTDLDDRLAERALTSLEAELRRRERILRAVGASDLDEYRSRARDQPVPRLVVVIDEFAALAAELPTFLGKLVGLAQRGRSLGVHLVLATQRPAGVVDDDIRANTNLRLALRLHDSADARDVVGDDAPARFSRHAPGRAMLRLGPSETVVFQAARCTGVWTPAREGRLHVLAAEPVPPGGQVTELAVLVRSIRHAAALSDIAPPHCPWLPPLPEHVAPDAGGVGLVDVPHQQRRDVLSWVPSDGNLALLGAFGSGTTSGLVAVLTSVCTAADPHERHAYVVDARGDERLDALANLPHCAGVVRPHERERLARLLDRLVGELDRRRAAGGRNERPEVVLAVDGIPALRALLDGPRDGTRWEQLGRVVSEGAAVGMSCVMTAERPGAVPPAVLAACAERWIFHLDDAGEATSCGLRPVAVPAASPGRLVVASSGCEAQLAMPAGLPSPTEPRVGGPAEIDVLPAIVDAATMPAGRVTAAGELELAVGIDFAGLGVAYLEVPDGEHVLVAGPPRSGRTTALHRLVTSWVEARPGEQIVAVSSRRRALLPQLPIVVEADAPAAVAAVEAAVGRPCLLVVDDAEHVDDPRLSGLLSERRPGLLVVAAGRPESLRSMYGHWTSVVRRSRLGLLFAACSDTDGDVLGELLPRHRPLPPRPGLAWMVGGGRRSMVQVASVHDRVRLTDKLLDSPPELAAAAAQRR